MKKFTFSRTFLLWNKKVQITDFKVTQKYGQRFLTSEIAKLRVVDLAASLKYDHDISRFKFASCMMRFITLRIGPFESHL